MELMEIILARRSVRIYNGAEVPEEALQEILTAGLLAPSSRNLYPLEMIVVRDKAMLRQLARVKTAASGFLMNADKAIVVLGDTKKSNAWIEDASLAMIYMQLRATELGVGNCWVQCRGRKSQQKRGEPLSETVNDLTLMPIPEGVDGNVLVAKRIADSEQDKENLSADEFLQQLLGIPEYCSVLAILSLGMTDQMPAPHTRDHADYTKVHQEKM